VDDDPGRTLDTTVGLITNATTGTGASATGPTARRRPVGMSRC